MTRPRMLSSAAVCTTELVEVSSSSVLAPMGISITANPSCPGTAADTTSSMASPAP
jgi:hypothetical protein